MSSATMNQAATARPGLGGLFGARGLRARNAVLEREAAALRASLDDHAATVLAREATLAECEAVVRDREQTIRDYEAKLHTRDSRILACEALIAAAPRHTAPAARPEPELSHAGISPATADHLIAEWRRIAAPYAERSLRGGQELIEPYLVEKYLHDRLGRIIIATVEGRAWYDNLEAIELATFLRLGMLRRGDTVFDCGANQGIYSVFYSQAVGPAGRVVAFDPFPLNIDISRFNARLNNADNIQFIRAGLADRASHLMVAAIDQCVGLPKDQEVDSTAISLVPLDMFAAIQPDFVKIDIEGAEVNALEGAGELLAQQPAIYLEVHPHFLPRFGRAPMDVFKHIDLNRYTCYIHHPNVPPLSEYHAEFDITENCALYFVPKSRRALTRHLPSSSAA